MVHLFIEIMAKNVKTLLGRLVHAVHVANFTLPFVGLGTPFI